MHQTARLSEADSFSSSAPRLQRQDVRVSARRADAPQHPDLFSSKASAHPRLSPFSAGTLSLSHSLSALTRAMMLLDYLVHFSAGSDDRRH